MASGDCPSATSADAAAAGGVAAEERVTVRGVVVGRRRFGARLFLTLALDDQVAAESAIAAPRVQAAIARDERSKLAMLDAQLEACGRLERGVGAPMPGVVVETWRLARVSASGGLKGPERAVLAVRDGHLPLDEAAAAMESDSEAVQRLVGLLEAGSVEGQIPPALKRELAAVSRRLKGLPQAKGRQRAPRVSQGDLALLAAEEERLAPLHAVEAVGEEHALQGVDLAGKGDSRHQRAKKRKAGGYETMDDAARDKLLRDLKEQAGEPLPFDPLDALTHSELSDKSFVEYCLARKAPQIRWMVDRVRQEVLPRAASRLTVLDVGCGRGDLALNLAALLPEVQVIGVDTNEESLRLGRSRAAQHGLANATFALASATDLAAKVALAATDSEDDESIDQLAARLKAAPDVLVLGLHVCGGLADAALSFAARLGASALCATCCFHRHRDLRTSSGGPEWWGGATPAEGRRLAQLCELHDAKDNLAARAMAAINNNRIAWLKARTRSADTPPSVRLMSFPESLSPKNQVILLVPGANPAPTCAPNEGPKA